MNPSPEGWVVYLIRTTDGKIYTGITNNLQRRFEAHQKQCKGARFFRMSAPEEIVHYEQCANRSEATKREMAIKKLSRTEKLELIKIKNL
ncbi:MAG: GIY-YIG nuclease family protein [Parachlamydiaceae bacterium]